MELEKIKGLRVLEFGDPGELRTRLVYLVINGNKRATAGALDWDYEPGEPIEVVGEKFAVVDNNHEHVATHLLQPELSQFEHRRS